MVQQKKSVRRKKRRGTVTPSREPAAAGCVCCAVFVIVLVLCFLDRTDRSLRILFAVLTALTFPLMMTSNVRIDYDVKKGFVRRNMFGVSRRYRWEDVTAVRKARRFFRRGRRKQKPCDTIIIIAGKKRIRIGWNALHANDFIRLAKRAADRKENQYAADRSESISEG